MDYHLTRWWGVESNAADADDGDKDDDDDNDFCDNESVTTHWDALIPENSKYKAPYII